MRKYCFVLSLLFAAVSYSQEMVIKKTLPDNFKVKRKLQINNSENNRIAVLLESNKRIFASLYDENYEEIISFEEELFPKAHDIPIGMLKISDSIFIIYLTNKNEDQFGYAKVDFTSRTISVSTLDLEFKKETFLQSFPYLDRLYLLSIENKSSMLNFYLFDGNGDFSKETVDLSNERFRYWDNSIQNVYTLLSKPFGMEVDDKLVKVDPSTPNSLEISAASSKLILDENDIHILFESNRNITQIIRIDPADFSYSYTTFNKPFIPNAPRWKKANSFLFDKKFFGITATDNLLKFEVKDYETRETIAAYEVEKNTPINFKNTPILIYNSSNKNEPREIENENRFLRDVSDTEIGVSIYKHEDNYIVSIGSFENVSASIPLVGFPIAQIGFVNITGYAFFNIRTSNSTSFKSLFNEDFQYLEGPIPSNDFDKINNHINDLEDISFEDVFTSGNSIMLDYIDAENNYVVVKF